MGTKFIAENSRGERAEQVVEAIIDEIKMTFQNVVANASMTLERAMPFVKDIAVEFEKLLSSEKFYIKIEIDPNDETTKNYKFILYSTDAEKKYSKTLTIDDDQDKSNNTLELMYDGLDAKLKYTFEIHTGDDENPYRIFENLPYADISIQKK